MAKKTIRFKGVEKVIKNIQETFKDVKQSKQLQRDMGNLIVKRIQTQARRGKPMRGVGRSDGEFPDLSEFSIAARELLSFFNNFHPAFRKNRLKSNVTMTGNLVDAVSWKVKNTKTGTLEIFIKPERNKNLLVPDLRALTQVVPKKDIPRMIGVWKILDKNKNKKTNARSVYRALLRLNKGYKFLNINDKVNKSINVLVKRNLRRAIKARGF